MRSVTEADQEIGRRIQEARKRAGVSMRELGAAITVSVQQMQKYEAGVNRISAANAVILARTLGVGVTDLLGLDGPRESTEGLSHQALALARCYDRLPPSRLKETLHDLVLMVAGDRAGT